MREFLKPITKRSNAKTKDNTNNFRHRGRPPLGGGGGGGGGGREGKTADTLDYSKYYSTTQKYTRQIITIFIVLINDFLHVMQFLYKIAEYEKISYYKVIDTALGNS